MDIDYYIPKIEEIKEGFRYQIKNDVRGEYGFLGSNEPLKPFEGIEWRCHEILPKDKLYGFTPKYWKDINGDLQINYECFKNLIKDGRLRTSKSFYDDVKWRNIIHSIDLFKEVEG